MRIILTHCLLLMISLLILTFTHASDNSDSESSATFQPFSISANYHADIDTDVLPVVQSLKAYQFKHQKQSGRWFFDSVINNAISHAPLDVSPSVLFYIRTSDLFSSKTFRRPNWRQGVLQFKHINTIG